uniref:Uncharacterized protein n=1 Tax=Timema genevievae TaxID=629358 RepID=A0A7R9JQP9_TIMGE|nr:unnamed protein product [Timema genevievae]
MDTHTIRRALKTNPGFRYVRSGVFPADQLPARIAQPAALVIITDPHPKPGTSWVVIFIDKNGVGEYFDSYGFPPRIKIHLSFILKNIFRTSHNMIQLQNIVSDVCDHYCLMYFLSRAQNIPMKTFLTLFSPTNHTGNDAKGRSNILEGQDVCTRKVKLVKPLAITSIFNTLFPLNEVDAKRVMVGMSVKNNSTPYKQDTGLKRVAYLAPSCVHICEVWDLVDVTFDRRDMWLIPIARYCNDLIDTLVVDVCDTLTESADVIDLEQPTVTIYSCPNLSGRAVKLAPGMSHKDCDSTMTSSGKPIAGGRVARVKVTIYSCLDLFCRAAKLAPAKDLSSMDLLSFSLTCSELKFNHSCLFCRSSFICFAHALQTIVSDAKRETPGAHILLSKGHICQNSGSASLVSYLLADLKQLPPSCWKTLVRLFKRKLELLVSMLFTLISTKRSLKRLSLQQATDTTLKQKSIMVFVSQFEELAGFPPVECSS